MDFPEALPTLPAKGVTRYILHVSHPAVSSSMNDAVVHTETPSIAADKMGSLRWFGVRRSRLICAAGIAIGCWIAWYFLAAPKPPLVSLTEIDPAVIHAVRQAQERMRWSPRSGEAWGNLATILYVHDFRAAAATAFTHAERFAPADPRWPYLHAVCLQQDDLEAAMPYLRRASELCGAVPPAPHLRYADALVERGNLDDAAAIYDKALQHDPFSARALLGKGRIAIARGNKAEARDELEQSVNWAPKVRSSHSLLALVCRQLGDEAEAKEHASLADKLPERYFWPDPFLEEAKKLRTGREADVSIAEQYFGEGRYREVIPLLSRTVANYPDAARPWSMLGRAYVHVGDLAAAERALRTSLRLDPNSVECQIELGVALSDAGRESEAEDCFREAARLKPDAAEAWINLGMSQARQQAVHEAIESFDKALRLKPDLALIHSQLGEQYLRAGQKIDAERELREAIRLDPSDEGPRTLLDRLNTTSTRPSAPRL